MEADGGRGVDFNRFDVSAKELVWDDPDAWLDRFSVEPRGPAEVIDSDITTLSAAADKVVRVGGPAPYRVNIELQSYHATDLTRTLWFRQVALDYRHGLPVLTILVLLCKEANSPHLSGVYERRLPDGWSTNRYNYRVVRLWNEDPEPYLTAGVGLVPLAPLADVPELALPGVVRRMAERINAEPRSRAAKLWTASYLLMGLRFPDELVTRLLGNIQAMKESSTYQAILRQGRQEGRQEGSITGEQRMLLRQGTKRFGAPEARVIAEIEAIQDIEQLEVMGERILDPDLRSWEDLLHTS